VGQRGISKVLVGLHDRVGSVALGYAGQLACQRWDRAEGGESRVWVKRELKLILPKVKSKIFEYHFCSTFQDIYFLFHDFVHFSNV
jgi:hypothetical protein